MLRLRFTFIFNYHSDLLWELDFLDLTGVSIRSLPLKGAEFVTCPLYRLASQLGEGGVGFWDEGEEKAFFSMPPILFGMPRHALFYHFWQQTCSSVRNILVET